MTVHGGLSVIGICTCNRKCAYYTIMCTTLVQIQFYLEWGFIYNKYSFAHFLYPVHTKKYRSYPLLIYMFKMPTISLNHVFL